MIADPIRQLADAELSLLLCRSLQLWAADCGLQTADWGLGAADCGLKTADCRPGTADWGLQTGDCRLWAI